MIKTTLPAGRNRLGGIIATCTAISILSFFWASPANAYDTYDAVNSCITCHGDFNSGTYTSLKDSTNWGTDLMDGHLSFITGSCLTCHTSGPRSPVATNSSSDPLKSKGCVGCHGRDGDESGVCAFGAADPGNVKHCGSAAGLRNVHNTAGVTVCFGCHINDNGAVRVGERESPFDYGLQDIGLTRPCTAENQFGSTGLDNDGDGSIDAADTECSVTPVAGDMNGGGRADILLRNGISGVNWLYLMNGFSTDDSLHINTVGTSWNIVGNGNYNGDGFADALLHNSSIGSIWMYLMNSAGIAKSAGVATVGANWQVVANGDYNGDGNADILLRNGVTGANWMYLMSGTTINSSQGVNTVGTDWDVVGSGHYNNDDNSDILWHNSSTGVIWMYLMTGATIDVSQGINSIGPFSSVVGYGDYDGDGDSDILLRSVANGENWMYLMNGTTITNSVTLNTVGAAWQVAGSGDYNGNGTSDIMWFNSSTGDIWMYLMLNTTIDDSQGVGTIGADWSVVNVN